MDFDWNSFPENKTTGRVTEPAFNWMGPAGGSSSSGLSSPLGSELGSTETESEEDDFIAELTRQMADYMLDDDEPTSNSVKPTTGFYSAHNLNDNQIKSIQFYEKKNKELLKQQQKQQKGSVSRERREKTTEPTQKTEPKQQKDMEKKINRGPVCGFGYGGGGGLVHTREVGSGMRAIFLGGPDSRNGCSGTGVFLPRGTGNPPETRKKSRCSTVLIPAKVIHALQLHYNEMNNALSRSNGGGQPLHHNTYIPNGGVVMGENKVMSTKQNQWNPTETPQPTMDQPQMGLPQEWTY